MSRRFPLWLLVLSLVLAACGSGGEGDGGDAAAPDETTATGDETAAGGDECPEGEYPAGDIELVVGRSPGGGHDEYARVIAPMLEEELGVTIVVSNVEGAGGRVAANQLYTAPPDGQVIHLMEPNGLAAFQETEETDYDLREYTHLGIVNERPSTFAVAADSEMQTFEDLAAAGQDRELIFATSGFTSPNFINGVIAADAAGIQFSPVPHDGSAEAITSVVRGDTDYTMFSGDSIAEAVEAGDLKAIAQFGSEPLDSLGDTPMASDVGLEQFEGVLTTNLVLVAPPGVCDQIRETLTDAVQTALNSEELAQWAEENDRLVMPGTPEDQAGLIDDALSTYAEYADLFAEYLQG